MPPWSKKPPLEPEVSPSLPGLGLDWDAEVLDGVNLWQFAALAGLLVVFCSLLCISQYYARAWAIDRKGQTIDCDLRMGPMHKCVYFKEVFWNYLCAAMLEPLLSIVDQDATSKSLAANGLQLFGLLWWIYNLHDAFDCSDTTQVDKYIGFGEDATLQPFEYCLPFDEVEKLQDVEDWREFVKDTCGVSLTVYTACLPGAAVPKS